MPKNLHKIGQIASDRRETLWKRRAEREESKNRGPEAQKPQTNKDLFKIPKMFGRIFGGTQTRMHSVHSMHGMHACMSSTKSSKTNLES